MRTVSLAGIAVWLGSTAFGQPVAPTFEVASLKPSNRPGGDWRLEGGPGTNDPERIMDSGATLQVLLREAYGVSFDRIQGPGWISEERYDLAAKVPPGATKEQLKLMLQGLLVERFGLKFHYVSKDFPVYELTIAKGGAKLKENTETLAPLGPVDVGALPRDRDGFLQLPAGISGSVSTRVNGVTRMTDQGMAISILLFQVGTQLGSSTGSNTFAPGRIVDKTGLTGKYDFHLEYAGSSWIGGALSLPATPDGAEPSGGLPLIDAMEKQLGLKLTKTTAPLEVLVIDHAEKVPTEN